CFGVNIKIILVYFDVDKGVTGESNNQKIRGEIEKIIKKHKKGGLMILGDYNGHSELLEQDRREDLNGKMVKEWITDYDLILLNADCKCKGLYTRCRGDQKSAIDMVMVNEEMYRMCNKMEIDETKEIISFSDHNLINIDLNLGGENRKSFESGKWIVDEYIKRDPTSMNSLTADMRARWLGDKAGDVNELIKNLQEQTESTLKVSKKRRIGGEEGKDIECDWITENIKTEIRKKRDIRRKERQSLNLNEKQILEKDREIQKKLIQKLVREAKREQELKMNKEIKESDNKGKLIWKFMDRIRGKRRVTEEDVIYEDGKKMGKGKANKAFFDGWKGVLTISK
ncbi:unnamed protein product, partial [Meganyctiphanes norvegica]